MRASQKIQFIDAIARELQRRYTFQEIDMYLSEYKIDTPHSFDAFGNSKAVYAKMTLRGVSSELLTEMAADLEVAASSPLSLEPPKYWKDDGRFRLFIGHISNDKDKATRLRECLALYAISGFVAHQDIHPTTIWQEEIERALHSMDGFLAIHTKGFSASVWTQQEIGFAVARGVKIISFKMGEDPTGFISKQQALPRLNRSAEDIAKEVHALLAADQSTSARLAAASTKSKSDGPEEFIL